MTVTRLLLPFGKMPPKVNDAGVVQWQDYCAVTDVNSDKPDEIVLIDLSLTGLSKGNAVKVAGVSEAKESDMIELGVEPNSKRGLPALKKIGFDKP